MGAGTCAGAMRHDCACTSNSCVWPLLGAAGAPPALPCSHAGCVPTGPLSCTLKTAVLPGRGAVLWPPCHGTASPEATAPLPDGCKGSGQVGCRSRACADGGADFACRAHQGICRCCAGFASDTGELWRTPTEPVVECFGRVTCIALQATCSTSQVWRAHAAKDVAQPR